MTEYELIQNIRNGDRESFERLVELYQNKGMKTAYLILGNRSDAEDVLQETFVKIYLNISQLRNVQAFSSWFYKVLVRTSWEYYRTKKREVIEEGFIENIASDQASGLERKIIQKETDREMKRTINMLSLEQRMVIILFYYEGFSIREIAELTGTFEATVKSRMFLARKKLKKLLSGNVQEA